MNLNDFIYNINVELIKFDGENFAKDAFMFGRYGSDHFNIPEKYTPDNFKVFFEELKNGKTFPKYVLNRRFDFEIKGISRICLAQLTRDAAIFCSESHGLRPLDFNLVLPNSLFADEEVMSEYKEAIKHMEKAYVIACEHEIPYPESRYLGPHSQTISICASFTLGDFIRCCKSRTNNSFCDELNLVYRLMLNDLEIKIARLYNSDSRHLWEFYINKKNCIDDSYYTRTKVFNGDFKPSEINKHLIKEHAINDWRKSGWKKDLEYIYKHYEELLTDNEINEIKYWLTLEEEEIELPTTYVDYNERSANNAIKNMPYYKEVKNEE